MAIVAPVLGFTPKSHTHSLTHPTCARCRGKICTRDMTCDFCVGWSPAQWELFAKKRTYKERKRSRPSGSVPPAPEAMTRAGTSSEVPQPGTSSSSFSRPSGGQDKRGGSPGCTWCCVPGGGGGVSLDIRPLRASAPLSSAPSGAGEGEVARSQRTPPARAASSVASPRSSQLSARALSFSGRPVSILGLIPVSPRPLST